MKNKVLSTDLCKKLFASLLVYMGTATLALAQVTLLEDNPLEIRFSKEQSQVTSSLVTLSLSDLTNHFYSEQDSGIPGWMEFSAGTTTGEHYFLPDTRQFISPGRVNFEGSSD